MRESKRETPYSGSHVRQIFIDFKNNFNWYNLYRKFAIKLLLRSHHALSASLHYLVKCYCHVYTCITSGKHADMIVFIRDSAIQIRVFYFDTWLQGAMIITYSLLLSLLFETVCSANMMQKCA